MQPTSSTITPGGVVSPACPSRAQGLNLSCLCSSLPSAQGVVTQQGQLSSAATFWMSAKTSDWQIFHNNYLALNYGTYKNQVRGETDVMAPSGEAAHHSPSHPLPHPPKDGTTVHAPWKLAACMEPTGICLLKRLRPGLCPCEHSSFVLNTQTDPQVGAGVNRGSVLLTRAF